MYLGPERVTTIHLSKSILSGLFFHWALLIFFFFLHSFLLGGRGFRKNKIQGTHQIGQWFDLIAASHAPLHMLLVVLLLHHPALKNQFRKTLLIRSILSLLVRQFTFIYLFIFLVENCLYGFLITNKKPREKMFLSTVKAFVWVGKIFSCCVISKFRFFFVLHRVKIS